MPPLPSNLRRNLERAIIKARDVAEAGARAALEALTVHEGKAGGHLTGDQRTLRNRLRAHARQLGDNRNTNSGAQVIDRLVRECAYEHWHRMIFARFLAENDLLVEPESGVSVTLDEVEELARDANADPWDLASRYAQRMLPQIFRPDDPLLAVALPTETRVELESLLESLPTETFRADDSLGWVYQFWQSKWKDEVNASGEKITGATLPAVTQLFTEHYMVLFLLHNTIGAWHAGKVFAQRPELAETAGSEQELRDAVALSHAGGYSFEYLRFVKVEEASSLLHEPLEQNKSQDGSSTMEINYFDKTEPIGEVTGNLPHWRQEGVTYFVTFRTADSLPADKWKDWLRTREQWLKDHPRPHDEITRREYYDKFPTRIHKWLDQRYGKCVLAKPELRQLVEDAIRHFEGERYLLDEFVVTANHVHVLVAPLGEYELSDILHSWKSFTANKINEAIGGKGAFWQKESFDHIVRSPEQFEKIRKYISHHNDVSRNVDAASSRVCEGKSQDGSSTLWRPAAGTFDGWPRTAAELTVLDPCCGSGHFLVATLELLTRLRMDEEGLSVEEALRAVLRDNLFGLEIDQRCTQIAAFALAFAAWKLAGRVIDLPPLHVACCGIGPSATLDEWLKLAEHVEHTLPAHAREPVRNGLENLHRLFSQASELGSLIDPTQLPSDMFAADYETLQPFLEEVFQRESDDDEARERAVAAQGMVRASEVLAGEYTLVITNVPYLIRGKQDKALRKHIKENHAKAKQDLATAFVQRCLGFCEKDGSTALVTPQNWLFLKSYDKLRKQLLEHKTWNHVARLGPGAFDTISGEVVNVALLLHTRAAPDAGHALTGLDASASRTAQEKARLLQTTRIQPASQQRQLKNPDCRVTVEKGSDLPLLGELAVAVNGMHGGDSLRYRFVFWELLDHADWCFFQNTFPNTQYFGGKEYVFFWKHEGAIHVSNRQARIQGDLAWGKSGVIVSMMRELPVTIYSGDKFDMSCAPIVPRNAAHLPAIWCFCSSPRFNKEVRKVDQALKVTNATLVKVPFDLDYWRKVAAEKHPGGLPKPYSDDPTQWIFHGRPERSTDPLQVAVARLLGYRWPAELDSEMELADEARAMVARCDELLELADDDGIVCLPAVRAEATAAERLRRMLRAAYGPDWSVGKEADLLGAAGAAGQSLDEWLRTMFFGQHCRLFGHRPFIWHIWDGKKDGFHALVNYHKLCRVDAASSRVGRTGDTRQDAASTFATSQDGSSTGRKLLETLTYSYLGDWIVRQEDGVKQDEPGAEARLAAAKTLQGELEKILKGEPPYDIFVRWRPLDEQPIGWDPDINDGVRLNIRPLLMAKDVGRKGAGILRFKPNCKWKKDRGKEPQRDKDDFPWFWGWDEKTQDFTGADAFDGNRWNDLHYTNAFKQAARDRVTGQEADA